MSGIVDELRRALGESVITDPAARKAHSRDTWVMNELRDLRGETFSIPLAVVEARSTEEVSRAIRLCREARVAVVPYGGGSGVCGAIQVPEGAVVISTAKLRGLVALDAAGLIASFRAGTQGIDAENRVREDGLTIGHWPQSIESRPWAAGDAPRAFSTATAHRGLVLASRSCSPTAACCARARRRAPRPVPTCASSSSAPRERSASSPR
jgi:alkyldihydroxyacetonephosphate synthase